MRKKREVDLKIERLDYPNRAISSYEEKEVRFKGGIPGQVHKVQLRRNKKDYKEGKSLEILARSPLERNTPCPAYRDCNGCSYRTLFYESERELKKDQIERLLGISYINYYPSPKIDRYRNKMEYTFGDRERGGSLVIGLHKKNRYYEMVDTKACLLVHQDFEKIRLALQDYFNKKGLPFYNTRKGTGLLRHLVIRRGQRTGDMMVNLVTRSSYKVDQDFIDLCLSLDLEGHIRTIIHTENDSKADAVIPEKVNILYGDGIIEEEMNGLKFKISPFSFFQPNIFSAEILYEKVLGWVEEKNPDLALDLFSGTGTIAQIISKKAKRVIAVELVEEAVEKAKENADINGIKNIDFYQGDCFQVLKDLDLHPDLIITDPPREGIRPQALKRIIELKAETLIYVSCNPRALKENLKDLEEGDYKLEEIDIYDQFPRTSHVECIGLMSRK